MRLESPLEFLLTPILLIAYHVTLYLESAMYAIIKTGGKQFRVAVGDIIDVELLDQEGPHITFDNVLFLNDGQSNKVDPSHLKGCAVHAEILGQAKGPKVIAFKYKKCKNSRRTVGHRQKYTRAKITKIAHS